MYKKKYKNYVNKMKTKNKKNIFKINLLIDLLKYCRTFKLIKNCADKFK